ncbi:MAG: thioredoxin [Flammeovirgaceae bacterium]|nr:thioredoxin [Flammeovirgaceae bacterium]MBR10579.1 thioredoxin [Rickettsiales bacterium]HCX23384.1 rhodanese-like domain-containing protein [Cytophagales bacterium]|tara:strand:+ start:7530 stop:7922 length:393 start_codon:yes stop_codon:yes gene_type:complete
MKLLKYAWIAVIAVACSSTSSEAQNYSRIDNAKLEELMKDPELQLVDVRTPEEVAAGYIKGAEHIDIYDSKFVEKISKLDKTKPIAVYCAVGGRSGSASRKLQELGFENIYDLAAGYRGWARAGKPTVKD